MAKKQRRIIKSWRARGKREQAVNRELLWEAYRACSKLNPWKDKGGRRAFDLWLDAQCLEQYDKEPIIINLGRFTPVKIRLTLDPKVESNQSWLKLALTIKAIHPDMALEEIVRLAREGDVIAGGGDLNTGPLK